MGTHRTKHNKGRKPLYKEHRQDLWEPSLQSGDQTGKFACKAPPASTPTVKSNGDSPQGLLAHSLLSELSEPVSAIGDMGRHADTAALGRVPKTESLLNDTDAEIELARLPSFLTHPNLRSAKKPEASGSRSELTTRATSKNTAAGGLSGKNNSSILCTTKGFRLNECPSSTQETSGRSNHGSGIPPQNSAPDMELAARLAGPEVAAARYGRQWETPEALLFTAKRAARKACRYKRDRPPFLIDDIAQDVVCAFLETPKDDRPRSLEEHEVFSYNAAARALRSRRYRQKDELRGEVEVTSRNGSRSSAPLIDIISAKEGDSYCGLYPMYQKPTQLLHMEVLDALRMIERLPPRERALAYSLIDYGDVAEYALDQRVSLFDAMATIKGAREKIRAFAQLSETDFAVADTRTRDKPSRIDAIVSIVRDRVAPRTLADVAFGFEWVGDPPYESPPFRRAAKRGWREKYGVNCPLCKDAMVFRTIYHGAAYHRMATIDHILSRARGGGAALSNLWVVCQKCNSAKGIIESPKRIARNRGLVSA